jgi:hypothetical protein
VNQHQTGHVPLTGTLPLQTGHAGKAGKRDIRGETPPYRGVSRLSRLLARVPFRAVPMSRPDRAIETRSSDNER